jgi:outer membrane protein assembly factor BamB
MYGFDVSRLRAPGGISVRPPFHRVWTYHARSLVEFPPAIAYGRLYFANNAGFFFSVDAKTGKRKWRYASGRCQAESPAVANGTVFATFMNKPPCNAASGDGELIAFWAETGKVRWIKHIGASESSPLVRDGRVYVGDWYGDVYCFSLKGKELWRYQADGKVKDGLAYADGRVYFGTYGSSVYALNARTGTEIWKAGAQSGIFSSGNFYATPAVAYDRVYIGATDGRMYSFGATTGDLRWSYSTGDYVYSSASVSQERVYVGSYSGHFYCFDAATGSVLWSFSANGPISGSSTVIDGIVYFATLRGQTYGLDAKTGRVVFTFPDGKYTPVVAETGTLYLIGYAKIYALDPKPQTAGTAKHKRPKPK